MNNCFIDNRYSIIKQLSAEGNMSDVYLCNDVKTNQACAIKLFKKFSDSEETKNLEKTIFYREVETLQRVDHENIVKYIDCGIDSVLDKFYIVLEYVDGENLSEGFDKIIIESEYRKLELCEQMASGLEHLHKKNIIHRDIKPSNIMLDSNGNIKIIDFGISKFIETFYNDCTVISFKTPRYCSPEQKEGKDITKKSDIYSLGLVFYEIFKNERIDESRNICSSDLPLSVNEILSKMLKPEESLRYDSISEVLNDIRLYKKKLNQKKYIVLPITKEVTRQLFIRDKIEKDDINNAKIYVQKDLNGKAYLTSKQGAKDEFKLIGKEYLYICKINKMQQDRFIVVTLQTLNNADLASLKENAYELPYTIEVKTYSNNIRYTYEISSFKIINELLKFEEITKEKKEWDTQKQNIIKKWQTILRLQRKKLEQDKSSITYKSFDVDKDDDSIKVELKSSLPMEDIKFSIDDMLQMSTKGNSKKAIDVGYMRDYFNGILTIDLDADVDVDNISPYGEISINKNMVEVSLNRQEKALKSINYKDNVNPKISDIIFNPQSASSSLNQIISFTECHSNYMDESKLRSLGKALSADTMFLLQGPPGTGKTTFISELICQILDRDKNSKILIASQSNVAVDHSLSKTKELLPDIQLIRIGHKEKFSENVIDFTLDNFCKDWAEKVISKCDNALDNYKKQVNLDSSLQEKNLIIIEIEKLKQEIEFMTEEITHLKDKKEKMDVISEKWSNVNSIMDKMKLLLVKDNYSMEESNIGDILDKFLLDLTFIDDKLNIIIEDSYEISNSLAEINKEIMLLSNEMNEKKKDILEWEKLLGLSESESYEECKKDIETKLAENKEDYDKFAKIELICKDWKKRVKQGDGLLQESLLDANIVGATCLGIASLGNRSGLVFDWVIIDEAGKATPTEILVPMCLGKKIILVGDHKQLPPVVDETLLKTESEISIKREDLEMSLFEYLEDSINNKCKDVLTQQYRMHPTIGNLISRIFYKETTLISETTKKSKCIPLRIYNNNAIVWLTTCKRKNNKEEQIGTTFMNSCEVDVIFEELEKINKELTVLNLKKEVAIIAGYHAQKDLIRRRIYTQNHQKFTNLKIEVNTVDAFQGRESDIVFYSIVRSNDEGKLGFLKDVRRLNVAFSRAKELLIVVGNHISASKKITIDNEENPFIEIIDYILENSTDCSLKEV